MTLARFKRAVVAGLTPELLKPPYRKVEKRHKLTGHCYVASEAMFHLLGGRRSGYVPQVIRHEGGTHWYLRHKDTGRVLDLTSAQFKTCVPYARGRGCGFLTRKPSQRTRVVLSRARFSIERCSRSLRSTRTRV